MNIEQKAKAYDEALKEAVIAHKDEDRHLKATLERIFPELAESERIRKWIIDDIRYTLNNESLNSEYKKKAKRAIAWLEKQCEPKEYTFKSIPRLLDMIEPSDRAKAYCQKLIDTLAKEGYTTDAKIVGECLKKINGEDVPMAVMDEQKATNDTDEDIVEVVKNTSVLDMVEPKFKVGDWVVDKHGIVKQILSYKNGVYKHTYGYAGKTFEDEWRMWTIQDAKDGDVLVASDGSIFLFAGVDDCACKYYVALATDNYVKIYNEAKGGGYWETSRAVYPATKEQRDLLFQKMKEAGYEWNAEKKEAKKIHVIDEGKAEMDYCFTKMMNGEKVSSAWSEEDEKMVGNIRSIIEKYAFSQSAVDVNGDLCEKKFIDVDIWLKSLKDRMTWKPSEEQVGALHDMNLTGNISYAGQAQALIELYNDLKKLK